MSSSYPDLQKEFNQLVILRAKEEELETKQVAITVSAMLFNWFIRNSPEIEQSDLTKLFLTTVYEGSTNRDTFNTLIFERQAEELSKRLINGFTTIEMGVTNLVPETDESLEIAALREIADKQSSYISRIKEELTSQGNIAPSDRNIATVAGSILRYLLQNETLSLNSINVTDIAGIGNGGVSENIAKAIVKIINP